MNKVFFLILLMTATVKLFGQTVYPKEFIVAHDGSGQFKTIQDAINAVRDLSQQQVTIHIKKGIYHEKLIVPSWKTKIYLLGEDKENTVITNADYSGKACPDGKDAFGKDKFSTYTSYTVLVQGSDFKAENLTIENTSGRVGQAVALHVEGDRCLVKNCKLLGNQDTLYVANENTRQLYLDCYIEGTTDFVFGNATAVFQHCVLKELVNSYLTAAATTSRQQFGFVFFNCKLIADATVEKVYLGRPWRSYAKVVFIKSDLGKHILPEGWNNWGNPENEKTVLYAEFENTGAGASTQGRAKWSKQLTADEAKSYSLENILGGKDHWTPLN